MIARIYLARAGSVSIINPFKLHNSFCLCLASVHLPYPFHLVFGFQLFGHAVSLRSCPVRIPDRKKGAIRKKRFEKADTRLGPFSMPLERSQ